MFSYNGNFTIANSQDTITIPMTVQKKKELCKEIHRYINHANAMNVPEEIILPDPPNNRQAVVDWHINTGHTLLYDKNGYTLFIYSPSYMKSTPNFCIFWLIKPQGNSQVNLSVTDDVLVSLVSEYL